MGRGCGGSTSPSPTTRCTRPWPRWTWLPESGRWTRLPRAASSTWDSASSGCSGSSAPDERGQHRDQPVGELAHQQGVFCGSITTESRPPTFLSQVSLRPQGRLDALPGVAHLEGGLLAGQLLHQLHVPRRELGAHFVRDFRVGAVALVAALVDQPLAEELLVQHALVLAAAEALLAALGNPVAARIRGVDLVDQPDLPCPIDAELVLGVDEDEAPLARPLLAGREEGQRVARQLVPLVLGDRSARDQLARRDRLVVLADRLLGAGRQDGLGKPLVLAHRRVEVDPVRLRAAACLV